MAVTWYFLEGVSLFLLLVGFFERLGEQVKCDTLRTIRNQFSNLCRQRPVNGQSGEVTSRDVLLKPELAALVSALQEAAQEI